MHQPSAVHRTDHGGVSVEEAARTLGVSITTIRRWIREGRLQAKRYGRPQGYVLLVTLPETDLAATVSTAPATEQAPRRLHVATASTTPAEAPTTMEFEQLRLIERQQTTIMELSGRVGYLQAELEQAREQLKALEAPQDVQTAQESAAAVAPPQEPPARPWWQRVLFG